MSGQAAFAVLAESRFARKFPATFQTATGLPVKLIPRDSEEAFCASWADDNPLCTLASTTPGGRQTCRQTQTEVRRHLARKLAPIEIACWAGLVEIAVPVLVGGEHVATLIAGPVFVQKPSRHGLDHMAEQLDQWGAETDLRSVEKHCARIPVLSEERIRAMMELLTYFAQQLGECTSRLLLARRDGEPRGVVCAKNFVQTHVAEPLHMRDAARYAHLSPCYFCKSFRKTTGLTFTEYVARLRVEKAKTLLLNRSLRINEAGCTAGFQSLPYFDRVFKRYVGMTPKEFRAAQQL